MTTQQKFKQRLYETAILEKYPAGPKLNLGCGSWLRTGDLWFNLDKFPTSEEVIQWDLEKGWLPFDDDYFSMILAIDCLEHLPHRSQNQEVDGELFSLIISEMVRCSKHGAKWLIMTPSNPLSLEQPGHCRVVTPTTFKAFEGPMRSSGESRGQLQHGCLRVVKVEMVRTWALNTRFGRAHENIIWMRVNKHG